MAEPQPPLRDVIEDTMASFALEGMSPTPEQRSALQKLAEGKITFEQFRSEIHGRG